MGPCESGPPVGGSPGGRAFDSAMTPFSGAFAMIAVRFSGPSSSSSIGDDALAFAVASSGDDPDAMTRSMLVTSPGACVVMLSASSSAGDDRPRPVFTFFVVSALVSSSEPSEAASAALMAAWRSSMGTFGACVVTLSSPYGSAAGPPRS